jgi:integrase
VASITRLNGRWKVRYWTPDGQRQKSKTFDLKGEAQKFARAVETAKDRGEWIDPALGRTTFGQWSERFMDTTVHLKPKTRAGYAGLLRTILLPAFEHVPLVKLQPLHVRQWVAQLSARGLSPSRIRQAYYLLGAILRSAVESGYIVKSPCIGIKPPKMVTREMHFLPGEEVERLAQATPEPYGVLTYTLAYVGLRWGEATALRRRRCDLLRSRVEIAESLAEVNGILHFGPTKTYASRSVVVPRFLAEMLARHLAENVSQDPDALVFASVDGTPLRHHTFHKRWWTPAVKSAHVVEGLRIHDLRHTCAALLIAQSAHPKQIQTHLGHSSITVTMDRYGHLFPDDMERLAQALEATFQKARVSSVCPERSSQVLQLPAHRAENTL